jgi:predicted NodU family carbamoyl transferase
MNGPGEPIVETPEQAVAFLRRSGADVLYLERFRLTCG